MTTPPDYLDFDSPAFALRWPKRIAKLSDELNKLHIQALCLGYLVGVGMCNGWNYTDGHCIVAAAVAWISVVLPPALRGTAQLLVRHQGVSLLRKTFEARRPFLTADELRQEKQLLELRCAELVRETEN